MEAVRSRGPFDGNCDVREILHPEISGEIDIGLDRVKARLVGDPILRSNEWGFREAQIDGLISIQKQVNVDVSDEIVGSLEGPEDIGTAIKHTLLTEVPRQSVILGQDENGFMISSRNLNLGITGFGLADQSNPSTKENIPSATIQFGCLLSYVRVIHFMGRYYLRDGYHRVYGLKKRGFTHTPCILIEANSSAEIGISAGLFPLETVLSPNPPLFRDFFDNAVDVQVPRFTRVLRLRIEPMLIPS